MLRWLTNKLAPPSNPSEKLRFYQSRHRIDDAYLADLLGQQSSDREVSAEIAKMCQIVEAAIAPLEMRAMMAFDGARGSPHDKALIGYLVGWLNVFKVHIWGVMDFNRSFFHYGFLLWFIKPGGSDFARFSAAMDAMTCMGFEMSSRSDVFLSAWQRGAQDATDFLRDQKPPQGPHLK